MSAKPLDSSTVIESMLITGRLEASASLRAAMSATAVAWPRVAPVGALSVRAKRSWASVSMSSTIGTLMVREVSPGKKPSTPLRAMKSLPEVALTPLVAKATVTTPLLGLSSVTTKRAMPERSSTMVSLTLISGVPAAPSLAAIMTTARLSPRRTPCASLRATKKPSAGSATASLVIAMRRVYSVWPGANTSTPSMLASKSAAVAVPAKLS